MTFSQKTIGHTPLIAPIEGGERESAFRLVARYLLKAYVVKRESYKFSELALQDVYIQNTSSKPVYTQFNDTMQPDSPTSPARLYQWAYDQKVNITAVNFIGSDDAPEREVVSFTTKLVDENDNFIKESKAVANIAFTMPLIEDMMSKKANMAFQVRSYHVNVLE